MDELTDIGRKLDVGVKVLKDIKGDTSALIIKMREHNKEQKEFNQELRDHNKRLEKILEKLAAK